MRNIKIITNRKNWLRLLCGRRVTIGSTYGALTALDSGETEHGELTALSFENGALLLGSRDRRYFVFTSGDLAGFGRRILTDHISCTIRFREALTRKTDFSALRARYYRVPLPVMDAIERAVSSGCF